MLKTENNTRIIKSTTNQFSTQVKAYDKSLIVTCYTIPIAAINALIPQLKFAGFFRLECEVVLR